MKNKRVLFAQNSDLSVVPPHHRQHLVKVSIRELRGWTVLELGRPELFPPKTVKLLEKEPLLEKWHEITTAVHEWNKEKKEELLYPVLSDKSIEEMDRDFQKKFRRALGNARSRGLATTPPGAGSMPARERFSIRLNRAVWLSV